MEAGLVRLEVIIGVPFCVAASIMAFLFTYEGYMRGNNPDRRLAFRTAVKTSLAALAAFAVVLIGITFFVVKVILG